MMSRSASRPGPEDLLTPKEFEAVLSCDPRALKKFCLAVLPIFRGQAEQVLRLIGQGGRKLEEDLMQDLMEALLKNDLRALRRWDPTRGTLRTYMRVFADRRTRDQMRGRSYGRSCEKMMEAAELAELSAAGESALSPEEADFWQHYRKLFLARANNEQKELYERCYMKEEPLENVAAQAGITLESLYKRLERLRKFMFELREELLDKDPRKRKN